MYRLKLLGGAAIESDQGPLAGRGVQRRRLALLAYLVLARGRAVPREKVAAMLWPEADADRARHQVSDAVYRINQAVGAQAIVAAGEELRLDAASLPSDASVFLSAIADEAWERAVAVYAGPLLDGFFVPDAPEFERWADVERGNLGREYVRALEALATGSERAGDRPRAVEYWRRAAVQEPYSSRIAVRLMHALDAIGERAAALKHARIHAELVRQDLGAPPDAEVAALAESWRVEDPVPLTQRIPSSVSESVKPPPAAKGVPATTADLQPSDESGAGTIAAPHAATAAVAHAATADGARAPSAAGTHASTDAVTHAATAAATRATSLTSASLWRPLVAVALVLFVLVALIQYYGGRSETRAAGGSTYRTVAVLPFLNLSGDPANEYMSDGITDELINTFARVPGVRVTSRTSAFSYKGTRLDVKEIGRRLGVEVVLEGSVRRAGDRLRVAAQLVGVGDGYQIWSQTFDRSASDVFAIQEEISRAIVGNMRGQLGAEAPALPRIAPPADDPESYDLYLKGRFAWHQRNEAGLRSAVEHFTASVTRAPRYARAWAGLADAYAVLGFYDYLRPREAFPRAREAADRALALDSTYGAPLATRGYVSLYYDWSFERAEGEFRRSIAIDPTYSTAHQWYGNLLTSRVLPKPKPRCGARRS